MKDSLGAAFRRSSSCSVGTCVEVARSVRDVILVRDSKDTTRAPLSFTKGEWIAFVEGVKNGEFDL
ncbi:DUF397 domain-containing protein [Pseudonocardia sp.]|uniref:DUF397 domain-containing protein n=1 Tax=Pseudonocardia sp. TaxID=60912 RepID=UPI002639CBAB|nr:DUF397 domain-containing protein [Pseudonocardia sp.]